MRHRRRMRNAVIGRRQVKQEIPADAVEAPDDRVQHLKPLLGGGVGLREPRKENLPQRRSGAITQLSSGIDVRQPRQQQGGRAQVLGAPTEKLERPKQIGEVFVRMKEALVAAEKRRDWAWN